MKHFRLFLIVLIVLLCAAVCACADSMTFTLLEDGSGYELTSCDQRSVTVTIPAEYEGLPVVSIAGDAFINCKYLEKFETAEGQPVFYAEDGVLFTDDPVKTLVRFPNAWPHTAYQIPEGTVALAPWCFSGQLKLTYLHIPEGVKSVGDYAFAGAATQYMVYVPNSLKTIGKDILQNATDNVPFYGSRSSAMAKYCEKYNIPFGGVTDAKAKKQTLTLGEPDLTEAEGLPEPDPGKIHVLPLSENYYDYDFMIEYTQDFSAWQDKGYDEIRIPLDQRWTEISAEDTTAGLGPRTGLYGIGRTETEAVLRGYDKDGKLTGTRTVSGDFVFSLPGAWSIGVAGGSGTKLFILPYEPVIIGSDGSLPLSEDLFHYNAEGCAMQFFICPFPHASVSFDFPYWINIFGYSHRDVQDKDVTESDFYSVFMFSLNDPYLIPKCNLINLVFDYEEFIYQSDILTCYASTRFKVKEDYGKKMNDLLDSLETLMSGTYYPADAPINAVTVRVNGGYPVSYRSQIELDEPLAKFTNNNYFTYAHEMVHSVDQTLELEMPSAWMEGRAEYIAGKLCDQKRMPYSKYKAKYNWSFLSEEDKADFFRYYTESTNAETNYTVGYYFFKYLCDTYGEDVSAKIMANCFAAKEKLPSYSWQMPMETFRQCVTDATEPDVFQNFVRDVVEKK